MDTSSETTPESPPGEGYLSFVGYLQIVAGVLTMLFSLFGMALAFAADEGSWLNPAAVYDAYEGTAEGVVLLKLTATYVAVQLVLGWAFGLLLIVAGAFCLKPRAKRFVAAAAIINLVNFPHGTTVGILVLHGLGRPGVVQAFR